jgi:hypothetical protein
MSPRRERLSETTARLETVFAYRAKGLKCIPLRPGSKTARVKWKRYQTAWPTECEYEEWFGEACNIAALCGDVVVVDCDSGDVIAEVLDRCGDTPMRTATPTPGHQHLWYRARPGIMYGNSVKINGKPIDLRSLGGYVVVPWSTNAYGVPYHWLGAVLPVQELPIIKIDYLRERKRSSSTPIIARDTNGGIGVTLSNDPIRNIMAYVRSIPSKQGENGSRGLMRVCYLLAERFPFGEALHRLWLWNQEIPEPAWERGDLHRALTRAFRKRSKEVLP